MRLTEKEIIAELKRLYGKAEPFKITLRTEARNTKGLQLFDVLGTMKVGTKIRIDIVLEVLTIASPLNLRMKISRLRDILGLSKNKKTVPIVVAPYIGVKQGQILRNADISWIDISGNFRISVPPRVFLERTGNKNKFPDTAPIKKIFQGVSGLVSRALLSNPKGFRTQYELVDFINKRNGKITNSTVSRIIKKLCDELLVIKEKTEIKTVDAEQLLERLQKSYNLFSENQNSYRFAVDDEQKFLQTLRSTVEYVSYGFYAAQLKGLATTDQMCVVVRDLEQLRKRFRSYSAILEPDSEFGNLIIIETNEPGIWFNIGYEKATMVVDDIELYLEMMVDKPRGPKIAEILKEKILEGFRK